GAFPTSRSAHQRRRSSAPRAFSAAVTCSTLGLHNAAASTRTSHHLIEPAHDGNRTQGRKRLAWCSCKHSGGRCEALSPPSGNDTVTHEPGTRQTLHLTRRLPPGSAGSAQPSTR